MKILYFLSEQNFGLTSLFVGNAISLNKLKNLDIFFVTGSSEKETGLFQTLQNNSINFVKIKDLEHHIAFKRQANDLLRLIDSLKPEFIHVQTNWQLALVSYVKFFGRKDFKIFYTIHHFRNNHPFKSFLARFIMGFALCIFTDKIFVCSTYTKNNFKFLAYKIHLLFLGVDDTIFTKHNNLDFAYKNKVNLIFPGQFRKGKNQDIIIKAFAKFLIHHPTDDFQLILPGDGEFLQKCIKITRDSGLENYIKFPGFLSKSQMISEFNKCSIVIVPSNSETFGLVIAEAFSSGRCIISRNVGVARDIIKSGENGFIFQNENDLIKILKKLFLQRSIIFDCGNNAFNNRMIFNWDVIATEYQKYVFTGNN